MKYIVKQWAAAAGVFCLIVTEQPCPDSCRCGSDVHRDPVRRYRLEADGRWSVRSRYPIPYPFR
jgi:hypothetical protein